MGIIGLVRELAGVWRDWRKAGTVQEKVAVAIRLAEVLVEQTETKTDDELLAVLKKLAAEFGYSGSPLADAITSLVEAELSGADTMQIKEADTSGLFDSFDWAKLMEVIRLIVEILKGFQS